MQEWWKRAVFYQIYPRSYHDSDGDGIGDLQGIIDRLDYLNDGTERSLGINAIWLSPTFPSPMKDFGYDVADYRDVHPDFGDLETMDRLIGECHSRDIRLLLDFVPNHSSDQHAWFQESRSSRVNPKRDWYIWRDAKADGSLPNNWISVFGGPAWTFDDLSGQYYLHSFLKEQPDLNWRNPEVVRAMHDVLRFWLGRGIDGFRIDVMGMVIKHPNLEDNPVNPDYILGDPQERALMNVNNVNYPDVFEAVVGIRDAMDEFPGSVAVGEVFGGADIIARYHGGDDLNGLQLAFNFQLIMRNGIKTPWDAGLIRGIVTTLETTLPSGAQPCYAFNNHDQPRLLSRQDDDGRGAERARAAALVLLGMRATPFLYYGEEIGMVDGDIPEDKLQDPARFLHIGRDPERTPMQWDGTEGRGFTTGEPWLPFGPARINVAEQLDDSACLLGLYRRAIWLRKQDGALHSGGFRELESPHDSFVFERTSSDARHVLVVLSTALESLTIELPDWCKQVLISTDIALDGAGVAGSVTLPALGAAWIV